MKVLEAIAKAWPILEGLLPPQDATEQDLFRWRLRVVFCQVVAYASIAVLSAAMYVGFTTHVSADELDSRIQMAVAPIVKKVDSLEELSKKQWTFSLVTQIKEARNVWCNAPAGSTTRARAQDDIDRLQDEYQSIKKERYPVASCAELTQ